MTTKEKTTTRGLLEFNTNNGRTLYLHQYAPDGNVIVTGADNAYVIPNGDFVMLLNLYRYVKDGDIQNDFINPNGKNRMD